MATFRSLIEQQGEIQDYQTKLMVLIEMADSINNLNEGAKLDSVNNTLGKMGIKITKHEGILDYIKKFSSVFGKVFLYIIKGDTEKAKELLKTLTRGDFIDFVLKLDLGTLHMLSEPLHMIAAWTGWDIEAVLGKLEDEAKNSIESLKQAVSNVKNKITTVFSGKKEKKLISYAKAIEHNLN